MIFREDILAKHTAKLITKIIGEPGQGNIYTLEQKLTEKVAKIKTTDVVEKGENLVFSGGLGAPEI